jgi:tetratricopeptide (TPR) repeat protein
MCAALSASAMANTVLVLPFFNLTGDSNLDWIGESIADTVVDALSADNLLAVSRDDRNEVFDRLSVRRYTLLTKATVLKMGSVLDSTQVVYGQFEIAPGTAGEPPGRQTIRISGRVIDLRRMAQGSDWLEMGALEDLARLESRIAWLALHQLSAKPPSERDFLERRPPLRIDALENYVRGLLATDISQKTRFFTQAARLDDRYAAPNFELGKLYVSRKEYRFAVDWLAKVHSDDTRFNEAQFLLGLALYHTHDFAKAEQSFQTVAQVVPLNEVFNNLGAAQSRRNVPAAIENFRKALQGDDADPDYHFNLGYALWKQKQFAHAADSFRAVLDRKPDDAEATVMLGRCLKQTGPRPGDPRSDGLERVKNTYEETVYRQLKATLEGKSR